MKLSEHFSLDEFVVSQTAVRQHIDNTAPGEAVINLTKLAAMLEQVRTLLGHPLMISSGYRCPALNAAVGSSSSSHHLLGGAADFTCLAFGKPLAVARAIEASDIPFGQLIHEFGSWVHISILPVQSKINRVITIDRSGTRPGLWETS